MGLVAGKARASAAGLYASFYYLGGAAGAFIPGLFWHVGGWRCHSRIPGLDAADHRYDRGFSLDGSRSAVPDKSIDSTHAFKWASLLAVAVRDARDGEQARPLTGFLQIHPIATHSVIESSLFRSSRPLTLRLHSYRSASQLAYGNHSRIILVNNEDRPRPGQVQRLALSATGLRCNDEGNPAHSSSGADRCLSDGRWR